MCKSFPRYVRPLTPSTLPTYVLPEIPVVVLTYKESEIFVLPLTCNISIGAWVPIPTLVDVNPLLDIVPSVFPVQ